MTLVKRERGPRCENCLKPIEVGQVALWYDDAGEMHADCEHPYSTKYERRDGEPAPVVLLGEPMVRVPLAILALPPSGVAEMWQPIETVPDDLLEALLCWPAYKLDDDCNLTDVPADVPPLVARGTRYQAGRGWDGPEELEANGSYFNDEWEFGHPTHFQRLPAPPADLSNKGVG